MRISENNAKAVLLADITRSSTGAPSPMTLAGEHHLHLAYVVDDPDPDWDGTTCRMIGEDSDDETCCLLTFDRHHQFSSYAYDVDHWHRHPLAKSGLEPFSL